MILITYACVCCAAFVSVCQSAGSLSERSQAQLQVLMKVIKIKATKL